MRIAPLHPNRSRRDASAITMIEMMVTITVAVILGSFLLITLGKQSGRANEQVIYLQDRDALMALSDDTQWNYNQPGEPNEGRLLTELHFDGSIQDNDLHYLWEIIQPHFKHRDKLRMLNTLNFSDSEFADNWMTNLIGVDRTGYPYRTEGLEILTMENSLISDRGLAFLYQHEPALQPRAGAIQQDLKPFYPMKTLKTINVYGCPNVTRKGVAKLRKAFPNLIIISTWDPSPAGL
jgi:type II secretory pathway pseudopilin PulG